MKIAVLKENHPGEARVALSPEMATKYQKMGFSVLVESGAGTAASFPDASFEKAGAKIIKTRNALLKDADLILGVHAPLEKDVTALKKNSVLISQMNPHTNGKLITAMAKAQSTAMALELIPRITRAQSMDILSSQANLGGYRAVIDAVYEYGRAMPMMMTAAGTVKPAKVLVVGAGVAGLQAIATAKRLGAVVSAFDVRPAVKEQVMSLGAKFIDVEDDGDDTAETKGGYAKETSGAYKKRQAEKMHDAVAASDIVITTALIPGKKAPRLVTKKMIEAMKPGSVLLDMAVASGDATGGNIEGAILDKVVSTNGKKIIGYGNLPSRLAEDASALFARNLYHLVSLLWDQDKKALKVDMTDDILKGCVLTHDGEIMHPDFKEEKMPAKKSTPKKGETK